LTISPEDWEEFISHFDWSGGNTGNSKGKVEIYRGNGEKAINKKNEIILKQIEPIVKEAWLLP
jgi:hypothetical protein